MGGGGNGGGHTIRMERCLLQGMRGEVVQGRRTETGSSRPRSSGEGQKDTPGVLKDGLILEVKVLNR